MNFLHAFHLILRTFRQPSYFLSKRVIFVLTLAIGCVHISAAENPFSKLASDLLGKDSADEKWNVAVGSFNYENTDLQSPFSSMLRDELEIALGESGKFKVVTRDRLADLQMEGKFQGKGILEPGTGVEKVTIEGVKGIVRGRFYSNGDELTIYAELAWLEGGEIKKARLTLPLSKVRAKIWPDPVTASTRPIDGVIKPQNVEQSLANVQEIGKDRLAITPEMSLKLAKFFKQSAQFWFNIQTTCDFRQLLKKEKQITAGVTKNYTALSA